jgi:hypothetical protein
MIKSETIGVKFENFTRVTLSAAQSQDSGETLSQNDKYIDIIIRIAQRRDALGFAALRVFSRATLDWKRYLKG